MWAGENIAQGSSGKTVQCRLAASAWRSWRLDRRVPRREREDRHPNATGGCQRCSEAALIISPPAPQPPDCYTSATLQNAARRLVPLRLSRPRCWRRAVLRLRARHARCASPRAHPPPPRHPAYLHGVRRQSPSEGRSWLRASVGLASESSTQNPLKFIFRGLSTLPTAASLVGRRATYRPAHDPHTPLPWTHASWSPRLPSSRALSSW